MTNSEGQIRKLANSRRETGFQFMGIPVGMDRWTFNSQAECNGIRAGN